MDNDELAKMYAELWKSENPIKTAKLMAYLATQPLLALGVTRGQPACYFFSTLGIVLSVWWLFCIGRTIGYQRLWKLKLTHVAPASFFPTVDDKKNLPWYGKVSSSWVLLAPVAGGALIWLIVLVFICGRMAD
jgi:hypothetical protein